MKIFITGGLGFVGRSLSLFFLDKGHQVTAVGLSSNRAGIDHPNFSYMSADTTQKGNWQEELREIDYVVNLAGKSIFSRWTEKYKKIIYDSRILTTRNLVEALPANKEVVLCSTSAVGYYGDRGDDKVNENEPNGFDFLANVAVDWEKAALEAKAKGIRVVIARFGVVLGKNGGALAKMIPAFRLMLGGSLGDGKQWFPWIHQNDLLSAILFVLENENINEPLNFCSPKPVRQRQLAKTLGEALVRPSFMPAPSFMIRLFLGEFGETLLYSQKVVPEKLLEYGFQFRYPEINDAINNLVQD
jgi:hypothetical protein